MKTVFFIPFLILFSILDNRVHAQKGDTDTLSYRWTSYIDLTNYLRPFLKSDTIYDELIMPISDGNSFPGGNLLFPVKEIISVRDTYYKTTYQEGSDWILEGQRLIVPQFSSIPFFKREDLVFHQKKENISQAGKLAGTYVLFSEGELIRSKQIAVTYIADRTKPFTNRPLPSLGNLPKTIRRLKTKKDLKIVFLGNSIEKGYNSSGFQGVPPFMPNWPEMIVHQLKHHYSGHISFNNLSVAGKMAAWGVDKVSEVIAQKPDLLIVGFGMNDGTARVAPDLFLNQIKSILSEVRKNRSQCEFIVVTPMLANPESVFHGLQKEYRLPLLSLRTKGTEIIDITDWHSWLLTHKSYQDMTGNNINHPNDYLSRWYAQLILSTLIP